MAKSIALFGAGPGLGQAIARRYGHEGYQIVLVARRRQPLELLAKDLSAKGITAHVVTADLSHTNAVPSLAERIRARVGTLDAFYYGPATGDLGVFTPATALTPQQLQDLMPTAIYTPLALVQEFLPAMLEQGEGAILTALGASAVQGLPHMSGPGTALAALRNYLQSLHAEVAGKGIYVGMLYIGALIAGSAIDMEIQAARAAGASVPEWSIVDPAELADLLWTMHSTKNRVEAVFPERTFGD